MPTLLKVFEEHKENLNISDNLPCIPNAELNVILGLGLSISSAFYDAKISVATLVSTGLLYIYQKRPQDSGVNFFKSLKAGTAFLLKQDGNKDSQNTITRNPCK